MTRKLEKAAGMGHTEAIYIVGLCYEKGWGSEQNSVRAFRYFKKAAKRDNAKAAMKVGEFLEEGKYVEQDINKAIEYYEKALSHGSGTAALHLGIYYEKNGNIKTAQKRYWAGSDLNNGECRLRIAIMYSEGKGVEVNKNQVGNLDRLLKRQNQDFIEKLEKILRGEVEDPVLSDLAWKAFIYQIGVESNSIGMRVPDVQDNVQLSLEARCGLDLFRLGTDESRQFAVKVFTGAKEDDFNAKCCLGICKLYGKGIEKNEQEAFALLKEASDGGIMEAVSVAGYCCQLGTGVDQSFEEAANFYRAAIERGCSSAAYRLGVLYKDGSIASQSIFEVKRLFRLADIGGYPEGSRGLAELFENGVGVEKNDSEAQRLKDRAAELERENPSKSFEVTIAYPK